MDQATMFFVAGCCVVLAATALILLGKSVSTGHSLMVAIGAAVIVLPYVTTFEWSDDTLKFTTREEAAALARSATEASQDEVQLREQIAELGEGMKAALERIATLERATNVGSTDRNPDPILRWNPTTIDRFLAANEKAKTSAIDRVENLRELETELSRVKPAG